MNKFTTQCVVRGKRGKCTTQCVVRGKRVQIYNPVCCELREARGAKFTTQCVVSCER